MANYRFAEVPLQRLQGYRFGILFCAISSGAILLINLSVLIWASRRYAPSDGIGTIQNGNCSDARNMSTWLHLGINVLGTLLLGCSNYTMQCLSAPTRDEIDRAHAKGSWLDIGISSIRNLRRIARPRLVLWILVGISSIPLLLLYNSVVFTTLSTRNYVVYAVSESFLQGAPFELTNQYINFDNEDSATTDGYPTNIAHWTESLENLREIQGHLQYMDQAACIKAYTMDIISNRADVLLLVSFYESDNNSVLGFLPTNLVDDKAHGNSQSSWIDYETHYGQSFRNHTLPPNQWSFQGHYVKHCLSERVEEVCKVQFHVAIMVIVIICNFIKWISMSIIWWRGRQIPLMTIGDAIASFLDKPDLTTERRCLMNRDVFQEVHDENLDIARWNATKTRWFRAASWSRWILCVVHAAFALGIVLFLYFQVRRRLLPEDQSFKKLWQLGFGTVTPSALLDVHISGSIGLLATLIIINLPQLLLSILYLAYNGVFTCMLLGEEWSRYAQERKHLRVTSPKGSQRSTYFLQLPYRYSIPLLITSGLLHWLVSQSIFLARIMIIEKAESEKGKDPETVSTCGFSPIAMLFVVIVGTIFLLAGLALGFRKYKGIIPNAGSCSAAISAACHPPEGDDKPSRKALMWGEVSSESDTEPRQRVGHASFTSFHVEQPVRGRRYA